MRRGRLDKSEIVACGRRGVNFALANEGKEKIPFPTKTYWQSPSPFRSYSMGGIYVQPTLQASVWLCCSRPSTCNNARLQKKSLRTRAWKGSHTAFVWHDCSVVKRNRPLGIKPTRLPNQGREGAPRAALVRRWRGCSFPPWRWMAASLPAGNVGWVSRRGFLPDAEPWEPVLCPHRSRQRKPQSALRSLPVSPVPSHGTGRRAKEALHLWNVTKTMSRKQGNENSRGIAD